MVIPIAFAAYTIPLCPILIPPQATTAQECHGVSLGATVTPRLMLGTFQLTSATSVEPPPGLSSVALRGYILLSIPISGFPVAF